MKLNEENYLHIIGGLMHRLDIEELAVTTTELEDLHPARMSENLSLRAFEFVREDADDSRGRAAGRVLGAFASECGAIAKMASAGSFEDVNAAAGRAVTALSMALREIRGSLKRTYGSRNWIGGE